MIKLDYVRILVKHPFWLKTYMISDKGERVHIWIIPIKVDIEGRPTFRSSGTVV